MSIIYNRVYVIVTQKCNFSCNFCYVYHGIKEIKTTSLITLLKLLKSKEIKIKQFVLIGGEPLNSVTNLKMFVRLIKKYRKKTEITITTNGYFLNKHVYNFLIKNKITIQVTIYYKELIETFIKRGLNLNKIFFHITLDKNIKNNYEILNIFNALNLRFWVSVDRRLDTDISDFFIEMLILGKITKSNLRDYTVSGKKCYALYGNQRVVNGYNIIDGCLNLISYDLIKQIDSNCINCDSIYCDACKCVGIHPNKQLICTFFKKIDYFFKNNQGVIL